MSAESEKDKIITPNNLSSLYWVYAMLEDDPRVVPSTAIMRRGALATIKNGVVVKPMNKGEVFHV